jgi:hypothetical protein
MKDFIEIDSDYVRVSTIVRIMGNQGFQKESEIWLINGSIIRTKLSLTEILAKIKNGENDEN